MWQGSQYEGLECFFLEVLLGHGGFWIDPKIQLDYIFQFEIFGGRNIRGGQVIDFLVFRPFATPLQVFGNYWHSGYLGGDDKLQLAILFQEFRVEPIIIWGDESETIEDATAAVRQKVL